MSSKYLEAYLLLIICFLSNFTHGIRLENGIKPFEQHKIILVDESSFIDEVFEKIILCKDRHCNSGKNRKLLTATVPSTINTITRDEEVNKKGKPISKEAKVNEKEKDLTNSQPVSENFEAVFEHYPDLVDIAEMDYSPAKRKPPIHN